MITLPLSNLPEEVSDLRSLALDLRWTWSHECDALWEYIDKSLWQRTRNPWTVLLNTPTQRLRSLASDNVFRQKLAESVNARRLYLQRPGVLNPSNGRAAIGAVAYFSMEFGLGAVLPLYAGGLGVLAGDFLKTASDMNVPVIGVGLLYQEGYFR